MFLLKGVRRAATRAILWLFRRSVRNVLVNFNSEDLMDMDPGAMTEEQQLEWALRLSLQDSADEPPTKNGEAAAASGTAEAAASNAHDEDVRMGEVAPETEDTGRKPVIFYRN